MNETGFIKRPTAEESDEDLIRMQEEWEKGKKTSVQIKRMNRKKEERKETASKSTKEHAGRFTIDLDEIKEESDAQNVLFGVQERNENWLKNDMTDEILKSGFSTVFSKDDGFPEPLDLSAYYSEKRTKKPPPPGKSFFAAEFDRIHGNLDENLDQAAMDKEDDEILAQGTSGDDFEAENEKFLKNLDEEKIRELRAEIEERIDPKLLEFLANRSKKQPEEKEKAKVSRFKARRQQEGGKTAENPAKIEDEKNKMEIQEMLNELEVLDEFKNREDREKYDRLATDAIQLDLTAKFGRNVVNRQQKNAVKLFDSCKFTLKGYDGKDELREKAREKIEEIKQLYLEEVDVGGHRSMEFAKGVNPILDNCWCLVPARRVLDAVEKRQGKVLPDDVEIVRLALFWTILLFEERKSAFFAFAQPNDFLVHLSEIFLIGSEILEDDLIIESVGRLINNYVLKSAEEGKISIRMGTKVAGLDAFMPFFENLLKCYEQYSLGNVQFARAILISAYLNGPIGDSLEYRFALWSPKRNIVRQMTISKDHGRDILEMFKKQHEEREQVMEEQHYVQYVSVLGAYVAAIRDELITRERNELLWEMSTFEIGRFVSRHSANLGKNAENPEKLKQFEVLVEIIRKSIGNKLLI